VYRAAACSHRVAASSNSFCWRLIPEGIGFRSISCLRWCSSSRRSVPRRRPARWRQHGSSGRRTRRTAPEVQVEVIEPAHDRQGVPDRGRCVAGLRLGLTGTAVDRSRSGRGRAGAAPLRVVCPSEPADQGCGVCLARAVPRNLQNPQQAVPAQQVVAVAAAGQRADVSQHAVLQVRADRLDLVAGRVQDDVGRHSVMGNHAAVRRQRPRPVNRSSR
jgi:hypothetical protein